MGERFTIGQDVPVGHAWLRWREEAVLQSFSYHVLRSIAYNNHTASGTFVSRIFLKPPGICSDHEPSIGTNKFYTSTGPITST
jgi:hypothetical protein